LGLAWIRLLYILNFWVKMPNVFLTVLLTWHRQIFESLFKYGHNKYVFRGNASSPTVASGASVDMPGNAAFPVISIMPCWSALPRLLFPKIPPSPVFAIWTYIDSSEFVLCINKHQQDNWTCFLVVIIQRSIIWGSLNGNMFAIQGSQTVGYILNCAKVVNYRFPVARYLESKKTHYN
jgi:hypothetical protein